MITEDTAQRDVTKFHGTSTVSENSFTQRMTREEIVPLGLLSSAASQNFTQPPNSVTLVISFLKLVAFWTVLVEGGDQL